MTIVISNALLASCPKYLCTMLIGKQIQKTYFKFNYEFKCSSIVLPRRVFAFYKNPRALRIRFAPLLFVWYSCMTLLKHSLYFFKIPVTTCPAQNLRFAVSAALGTQNVCVGRLAPWNSTRCVARMEKPTATNALFGRSPVDIMGNPCESSTEGNVKQAST